MFKSLSSQIAGMLAAVAVIGLVVFNAPTVATFIAAHAPITLLDRIASAIGGLK